MACNVLMVWCHVCKYYHSLRILHWSLIWRQSWIKIEIAISTRKIAIRYFPEIVQPLLCVCVCVCVCQVEHVHMRVDLTKPTATLNLICKDIKCCFTSYISNNACHIQYVHMFILHSSGSIDGHGPAGSRSIGRQCIKEHVCVWVSDSITIPRTNLYSHQVVCKAEA